MSENKNQKFLNPFTVIKNWPISLKIGAGIILLISYNRRIIIY